MGFGFNKNMVMIHLSTKLNFVINGKILEPKIQIKNLPNKTEMYMIIPFLIEAINYAYYFRIEGPIFKRL